MQISYLTKIKFNKISILIFLLKIVAMVLNWFHQCAPSVFSFMCYNEYLINNLWYILNLNLATNKTYYENMNLCPSFQCGATKIVTCVLLKRKSVIFRASNQMYTNLHLNDFHMYAQHQFTIILLINGNIKWDFWCFSVLSLAWWCNFFSCWNLHAKLGVLKTLVHFSRKPSKIHVSVLIAYINFDKKHSIHTAWSLGILLVTISENAILLTS